MVQFNQCIARGGIKYSNSYAPIKCEYDNKIYGDPKSVIKFIVTGDN